MVTIDNKNMIQSMLYYAHVRPTFPLIKLEFWLFVQKMILNAYFVPHCFVPRCFVLP